MTDRPGLAPVAASQPAAGDRGSLALEFVLVAPLFLAVLLLIYAYGKVSQVGGTLDAATRDAARVATQARSETAADQAATETVTQAMGSTCTTLTVRLRGSNAELPPTVGRYQPGDTITVQASCAYPLPGLPAHTTVTSTFSSTLDPNRGLD